MGYCGGITAEVKHMKPKERAVQSFYENQKLLFAINTLSIHTKLEMAGHSDMNRAEEIPEAKEVLRLFLTELEPQVQRSEEAEAKPLLGVDARRRQFVKNFVDARRNRIRSSFLRGKLSDVTQLIYSDKEADKQDILLVLEDLRMLIEEHIGSDVQQLFGGF